MKYTQVSPETKETETRTQKQNKKKNHSSSCSAQATVQWWSWQGAKHTNYVLWREKAQGPEATPIPLPTPLPLAANNQSLSQSAMNHMAHRRWVWEHEWWASSALFDTYVAECLVTVYSHVPDMHSFKEGPSNSHRRDCGSWGIWDWHGLGDQTKHCLGYIFSVSIHSAYCKMLRFVVWTTQNDPTFYISVGVTEVDLFCWETWLKSFTTIPI